MDASSQYIILRKKTWKCLNKFVLTYLMSTLILQMSFWFWILCVPEKLSLRIAILLTFITSFFCCFSLSPPVSDSLFLPSSLSLSLRSVSLSCRQPLLIFLDSVDQVTGATDANRMSWIPTRLPPNVKVRRYALQLLRLTPLAWGDLSLTHTQPRFHGVASAKPTQPKLVLVPAWSGLS